MSESTKNVNVTKNTAFSNMLGGYNGEKEYNKRNNPWTIDSNNDGKKEVNWSKAKQTFGDLLGDIAMFGIGALSAGYDDPIRGIGQGFQNVYARRNAMNTAANNYENYLAQQQKEADDLEAKRQAKIQEMTTGNKSGFDYGFDINDVSPYYDNQYTEKQWSPYQADYNTIQDKNSLIGFTPQTTQPTETIAPTENIQGPTQGVELQLEKPGNNEILPNIQPVNFLQGGVNETGYVPTHPMKLYNGTLAGKYNGDYIDEQNNIRTNRQSDINSQRSYNASMYGHNVSRQNALDRIAFEREQQANNPKGNDVSGLVALGQNLKEFENGFNNTGLPKPQGIGRVIEPIHVGLRAMNVKNPAEVAFDARRSLLFNSIARDLGGEKGVLSDQDIERVSKGMPSLSDSPAQKKAKMDEIYKLIDVRLVSKGYQPMFGTMR